MSYSSDAVSFDAAYNWDTEGWMTSINYGPQYQLTYDANGRLGGMSGSDLTLTASYRPAGEMLGLNYRGLYFLDQRNANLQTDAENDADDGGGGRKPEALATLMYSTGCLTRT